MLVSVSQRETHFFDKLAYLKQMLFYLEVFHLYLKKFNILFQGKERPAKTKSMLAKLCAVLVSAESDFVQC